MSSSSSSSTPSSPNSNPKKSLAQISYTPTEYDKRLEDIFPEVFAKARKREQKILATMDTSANFDFDALVRKHLWNVDCPFMEMYKAKLKLDEEKKKKEQEKENQKGESNPAKNDQQKQK